MKNIIKESILFTLILVSFIFVLHESSFLEEQVLLSFNLWLQKVVPILFPTFIIIDLIYSLNLVSFFNKFLPLDYVYFLSIITGSPANAYLIGKGSGDVTKVMATCKYTSLAFTYAFLKEIFSTKLAISLIGCNILCNFILLFFIKPKRNNVIQERNFSLFDSIKKSLETLIVILGTIIFFNILPVKKIENVYLKGFLFSLLEVTTSFNFILNNALPLGFKLLLAIISLSTCGLCIECQIASVMGKEKINYKEYIKYRLLHLCLFLGFFYLYFIGIY